MNYDEQFYQEYLTKVKKFAETEWVKDYFNIQKRPNFWSILEYGEYNSKENQKSSYEIRKS